MNELNTGLVTTKDDKVTTTSKIVADTFGKRHDNVIRDIESLEIPEDFRLLNFEESNYLNRQGKNQPAYKITKNGLVILAMGFTGKKAMKFKIAYKITWLRADQDRFRR